MLSQRAKAFSIDSLLQEDKNKQKNANLSQGTCPFSQRLQAGCHRLGCGSKCCHSPNLTNTDSNTGHKITAELCHDDLWQAFHCLGTEMIITKTGRRMFPALRVKLSGLKPDSSYRISLHFVPIDQNKYRYVYHSSKWMVAGPGDLMIPGQVYEHSDSPIEGIHLDNQVVSFERIKLTNSNTPKHGQISLVSMQKFQPQILVTELSSEKHSDKCVPPSSPCGEGVVFCFPQTSFMAVTAYQNQEITRLKIARNPFAKGFREAGKTRSSLDTIMASFGLTLSSKIPRLQEETTEEYIHGNHGSHNERTTPPGLCLVPNGGVSGNPVLPQCGLTDSGFPPPPAHAPELYSLEWYSKERESFATSMLLLHQYRLGTNVLPVTDHRQDYRQPLECRSYHMSDIASLQSAFGTVNSEQKSIFPAQTRLLGKRQHDHNSYPVHLPTGTLKNKWIF